MNVREQRGLVIAATSRIVRKDDAFLVPSQSKGAKHVVRLGETPACDCADFELNAKRCKHIYAAEYFVRREWAPDIDIEAEAETLPVSEKRTTYRQKWPAYNKAQTTEKATFKRLLHALCQSIDEPEQKSGRPRIPLRDSIFAAVFKVYSTVSCRRFMTDLRDACAEGHLGRCPCYNSVFNVFESEATFGILKRLVELSATPLQSLETKFACDSSGFSGWRFDRWYEHKYGVLKKMTQHAWVKAHVMVGVKTNVVAAVEILDQHASDLAQFPKLMDTTRQSFKMDEVSADLAYSSRANLETAEKHGAFPLLPFRCNATPAAGGLWAKMYHYFQLNRDEFLPRYHLRSNVESTFSMVKRKFGDSVRSKTDVAMKNEVLAKFVAHNIVCVIHEMHESGIDAAF